MSNKLKSQTDLFFEKQKANLTQQKIKKQFLNYFQKEKITYQTLSIRIDSRIKKWVEKLAKDLDTSVSKIVERALWMIKNWKEDK